MESKTEERPLLFALIFVFFIIGLKKFSVKLGVEKVWISEDGFIGCVSMRYLRKAESHLLRFNGRFVRGIKDRDVRYSGYVPYWIDSFRETVPIYDKVFRKVGGGVYHYSGQDMRSVFLYDRTGVEFFSGRISTGYHGEHVIKVFVRLSRGRTWRKTSRG